MVVPHNFTNKFQLLDSTNSQKTKKFISHKFNMRSDKFGSPLNSKSKTWFLTFLDLYVSESNKTKFWPHSFNLQNSSILQTRMDQKGTPWKWILTIFKYKNEYHKQSKLKNGMICIVSFFPSSVMFFKLPKIVLFFQICDGLCKKTKSI